MRHKYLLKPHELNREAYGREMDRRSNTSLILDIRPGWHDQNGGHLSVYGRTFLCIDVRPSVLGGLVACYTFARCRGSCDHLCAHPSAWVVGSVSGGHRSGFLPGRQCPAAHMKGFMGWAEPGACRDTRTREGCWLVAPVPPAAALAAAGVYSSCRGAGGVDRHVLPLRLRGLVIVWLAPDVDSILDRAAEVSPILLHRPSSHGGSNTARCTCPSLNGVRSKMDTRRGEERSHAQIWGITIAVIRASLD